MAVVRGILRWSLRIALMAVTGIVLVLVFFSWQAQRREVRVAADIAPPTGRFVRAADVDMFVQELGPADGPAVLFVHGTGAWSETWRPTMTLLAQAGFRAIALDLPPFGLSQRPVPARYGKLDQGKRIVGVLDALKIQRAVLVGHSFGGGPTVEAALLAPQRTRALVLVDAALSIAEDNGGQPAAAPLLQGFLRARMLRDSVVATFLTNPLFTRHLLQLFIDNPARATGEWVAVYQKPLVATGSTTAISEWLPELLAPPAASTSESPAAYKTLAMPVIIIWGGRDTITPLAQGQRLAGLVAGADLAVMTEVGHIPQIEDGNKFNALLLKRLTGLKPEP